MGFISGLGKTIQFAGREVGRSKWAKEMLKNGQTYGVKDPSSQQWRDWAHNLLHESGWSKSGIEHMIRSGRVRELKYVIAYLKSQGASNLSKWDRASLIQACIDKLEIFSHFKDLL